MPKDYAKFVPPKSRPAPARKLALRLLFGGSIVLALLVSGSMYFLVRNNSNAQPSLALSKISEFFQHKKVAPKLSAVAAPKPLTIRFDFYEQLPNMQMPMTVATLAHMPAPAASVTVALNQTVLANAPVKVNTLPSSLDSFNKTPKSNGVNSFPTSKALMPNVNPDALTHLLEDVQLQAKPLPLANLNERFLLELGEFNTERSANEMLSAIKSVGFNARVIKIVRGNHTVYQLHQGPFETQALALAAQQRMQKRGLISNLIKAKTI